MHSRITIDHQENSGGWIGGSSTGRNTMNVLLEGGVVVDLSAATWHADGPHKAKGSCISFLYAGNGGNGNLFDYPCVTSRGNYHCECINYE